MGNGSDELDSVQIDLAVWITTYKDIFAMDSEYRPSTDIIKDDHKLDLYLEDLQRKRKK